MNAFVSVIHCSLVYYRTANGSRCSFYKPEAIFKDDSFIVNWCGVDIEHCRAQTTMIPVSNSVAMVGI